MNKKQELLLRLDLIKNEHLKWKNYAEAKFKGINVDEQLVPVKHTECACGKMILEYGQVIYHLNSAHSLSKDHEEFHNIGKELYDFMKNKEKGNFFTQAIIDRKNKEIMNNYADTLENLSDILLKTLESIKKEIELTDEEKIEAMFSNPK